jgi:hypothetical protein
MSKYTNPKSLKGQDKINRITDLMSRMTTLNESTSLSEIDFIKKGPNGIVYGIIRENHNYFIKTTEKTSGSLVAEDFQYVGGIQNKYDERYHSYAEALKHLNMKFDMLNESYGIETGTNLFESDGVEVKEANASGLVKIKETEVSDPANDEVGEKDGKKLINDEEEEVNEKTVIKVDAPAPPPVEAPVEDEVEVDEFSMEDDEEDPFADEEGGEDMEGEEDMEDDDDEITKKIQKYTGKIGQLLRDKDEPDPELDKYVINSIVSAIDWEEIPDEDVEDIIAKIEGEDEEDDEFATGDEEVVDLDAEEGGEEDPFDEEGDEELAESEEDGKSEEEVMVIVESDDKLLGYIQKIEKLQQELDKITSSDKRKEQIDLINQILNTAKEYIKINNITVDPTLKAKLITMEKVNSELSGVMNKEDTEEEVKESRVFSKKQLMESFLKNVTKKSLKKVLKETHRICEECLGEGCEVCGQGMEEHHNLSYTNYGKYDDDEYITMKEEGMDVIDAIATGQGYLSATGDLDRDYDGIPNRLDMDNDSDGELDFEMGSNGDEGFIELDFDSIMGTEAPVKEPDIKEPVTRPGEGDKWRTIKRPKVDPRPKARRDRGDRPRPPRRSFRRKGMFR